MAALDSPGSSQGTPTGNRTRKDSLVSIRIIPAFYCKNLKHKTPVVNAFAQS